jgi:hypothetical protein
MHVNFIPDKGFKLLGTETGAFLADSENNDPQEIITDGWTEVPGTNQITIDKYTITLTRIAGGVTYAYKAITTVIGQPYSVSFNVISAELAPKMGVGDSSTNTSTERATISLSVGDVGIYILSFVATQTVHYVKLLNVLGAQPDGDVIFKNEVEIRHAEVVGSAEGIELNDLNNAISDDATEQNTTNGFTSFGLDGTGLNVFKTVSNLPYPEENTNQNAVSPDGITEADSTTGFTSVGLDGTGNNLFQTAFLRRPELVINGTFDTDSDWTDFIDGAANGTVVITGGELVTTQGSTAGWLGASQAITTEVGKVYVYQIERTVGGAGLPWRMSIDTTGAAVTGNLGAVSFSITGLQQIKFTATTTTTYLTVMNGTTAFGVMNFDNASCFLLDEKNTNQNAVSPDGVTEADSTAGFISGGLDGTGENIFRSVSNAAYPENIINGDFATDVSNWTGFNATRVRVAAEMEVTTTATSGGAYQDVSGLTPGVRYVVHTDFYVNTAATANLIVYDGATFSGSAILDSTATSSATIIQSKGLAVVPSGTTLRVYCQATGGIGVIALFDNVSLKESNEYHVYNNAAADPNGTEENAVTGFNIIAGTTATSVASPVDIGTYAISAETNTTPTANGRVYCSLEDAVFNLQDGREYLISVSARHNGTGGDWFISLGEFSTGSVTTIISLTNTDTTYITYTHTFTKGTTSKFLTFMETNVANDGGIYVDNLSITETQVNHGTYAIHAEANDTPTASARFSTDLNAAPYNLVEGKRYTIALDAKHVGVGGIWLLGVFQFSNGGPGTGIVNLSSGSHNTYKSYSLSWRHTSTTQWFVAIENSVTNDGGVFLDNLSIRESNEYYIYRNAASIYDETDSTTGLNQSTAITSSVSSPINVGNYALNIECNTSPSASCSSYFNLDDSTFNLVAGKEYVLTLTARHVGSGGAFQVILSASGFANLTVIAALTNVDTTYEDYSVTFTHSADTQYLFFRENSGTNDGGVYVDAISIVETQVNHGLYSIHADSNDTPTAGAVFYADLESAPYNLIDGYRYILIFDMKHVGVGGDWRINLAATNNGLDHGLYVLSNTDNFYKSYTYAWIHDSTHRFFNIIEASGTNDGGIYFDNFSIKESNEYFLELNAASDPIREINGIDGWAISSGALLTSVTNPINTGNYALSVESNTTPTANAALQITLGLILTVNKQYKLSFSVRHFGTGGIWEVRLQGTGNTTIVSLDNTDTTYQDISFNFVHTITFSNLLQVIERNVSNDGGVYLDNFSITEVQVNVGNYAFQAEANDTPTSLARCYVDMEANFGLENGKLYTMQIDAKHVGVGGTWRIALSSTTSTGGSVTVIKDLANTDVQYDTYAINWIHDSNHKYLVCVELTAPNDGGVYIDNLHVHESGELYIFSNAAADPAGLEDNSADGWIVANNALATSVTSPVDIGTYAISIESNTTPTALASGYISFEASGLNLTDGVDYTLSFAARHNGTGDEWRIHLASSPAAIEHFVVALTSTDTTYQQYSITFTMDSTTDVFTCLCWGTSGGVYLDNISVRRSDPDHSTTDLGLQYFGKLNKHVVNVNADLFSYSSFDATNNYLKQPHNPDINYSGNWFYEFWIKAVNNGTDQVIFIWAGYNGAFFGGAGIQTLLLDSGILRVTMTRANFGAQNDDINGVKVIDDNIWHKINLQRVVNDIYIYIDSILDTQQTLVNTATPNNDFAELWIGSNVGVNLALTKGELALFKTGGTEKTEIQISNNYNSEKYLFNRDVAYAQVGTAIDMDITVRDLTRSTEFDRNQNVSLGGNTETLFNRQDNFWNTTTTLIDFVDLKYHRLFFDSVIDGQTFTFDPYGVIAAPNDPKQVTFVNNKYTEGRQGQLDFFRVDFKVRE